MNIKYTILLLSTLFTTLACSMTPDEQLWIASAKGNIEEVKETLANGANIDAIGGDCCTALMRASHFGYTDLVRILLAKDVDVNALDFYGRTALIIATTRGHIDIVKLLIDNDANTKNNGDALLCAASWGHTEIAKLLVAAGVSLIGLEKYPQYLKIAQRMRNEVNRVFDAFANTDIKKVLGYSNTAEGFCQLFKEKSYLLGAKNEDFNTLLHCLVAQAEGNQMNEPYHLYRFKLFVLLISEYPALLLVKDKSGYTPLNLAIARGNHNFIKVIIELALTNIKFAVLKRKRH